MENYIQLVGLSSLGFMAIADAIAIAVMRIRSRPVAHESQKEIIRSKVGRGTDLVVLGDGVRVYFPSIDHVSAFHSYRPAADSVTVRFVSGNIAYSSNGLLWAMTWRAFAFVGFNLPALHLSGYLLHVSLSLLIPSFILGLFFWSILFSISYFGWQEAISERRL